MLRKQIVGIGLVICLKSGFVYGQFVESINSVDTSSAPSKSKHNINTIIRSKPDTCSNFNQLNILSKSETVELNKGLIAVQSIAGAWDQPTPNVNNQLVLTNNAPVLDVTYEGVSVVFLDIGDCFVDAIQSLTFTVHNHGTSTLELHGWSRGWSSTIYDLVYVSIPGDIEPGSTEDFSISFKVTDNGPFSIRLGFNSNDPTKPYYRIDINGNGNGKNEPPSISDIDNLTLLEDQIVDPIPFTVDDPDVGGDLTVYANSSNPSLVPDENIPISGYPNNDRELWLTLMPNQYGSAIITVTVSDNIDYTSDRFVLTVVPVNDPPQFIGPMPHVQFMQGMQYSMAIADLALIVQDVDNDFDSLEWHIENHPYLTPHVNTDSIQFTAPLTWFGTDTLLVTVSDSSLSDTTQLIVTVTPAPDSTPPAAPSGLTAMISGGDAILSWDANTEPDIASYTISRSTDAVSFSPTDVIGTVEHPIITFTDKSIPWEVTYYYMVSAVDDSGNVSVNNPTSAGLILSEIELIASMPTEFRLEQNYPNPFNPFTTISYSLPNKSQIKITVYNLYGRIVDVLYDGCQQIGNYSIQWDASNHPSGIYIIEMNTPEFNRQFKAMLMK